MIIDYEGPWGFHDESWKAHVLARPGVYRLRAWRPRRNAPRPIDRAAGVDDEGVLDIGMSGNLYGRVLTLLRACRTGRGSHSAGLRYHAYCYQTAFPLSRLRIEVRPLPSRELAEAVELALLECYIEAYKDFPPLNSTQGNWRTVEQWLTSSGRTARRNGWIDVRGLVPEEVVVDWGPRLCGAAASAVQKPIAATCERHFDSCTGFGTPEHE